MSASGEPPQREHDTRRQRELIRPLLVPTDPADAMTAYYALSYDARRVQLTLHSAPGGGVDGFVAVCQTGQDLFVPLAVIRAPEESADDLLRQAFQPGWSYKVITTPVLQESIERAMLLERQQTNLIYAFDPSAFQPVLNVMVQPGQGPFRFEVRVGGRIVSAAGVNWQSSRLAEMYVYTEPDFQGRGWGRAVGVRCVQALLEARLLPLYTVAQNNVRSQRLAYTLGFRDSGAREFECQGRLRA
jgi:RimJ/RimL family protein N-acetyltransferase